MENETLVWPVIVPEMLDPENEMVIAFPDEHALDALSYAVASFTAFKKPLYSVQQDDPVSGCFCAYCMACRNTYG